MAKDQIKVGITVGDINGVGLEVIIKTLEDPKVYANSIPIIYGSSKAISFHKKESGVQEFNFLAVNGADEAKPKKINVINCWKEEVNIILDGSSK